MEPSVGGEAVFGRTANANAIVYRLQNNETTYPEFLMFTRTTELGISAFRFLLVLGVGLALLGATAHDAPEEAPVTLFVHAEASPSGNGTSWQTALPDLQAALDLARATPSVRAIWISGGTFLPTPTDDRSISFELVDGVDLYGGFVGGESHPGERPEDAPETVLSGNIGNPSSLADDVWTVVSAEAVVVTLDQIVIERGGASGPTQTNEPPPPLTPRMTSGAGLFSVDSHIVLRNSAMRSNRAGHDYVPARGAAIFLLRGSLNAINVRFESNSAVGQSGGSGGAIRAEHARLVIEGCHFRSNGASGPPVNSRGGAISLVQGTALIRESVFENNGSWGGSGGALHLSQSDVGIVHTRFVNNAATNEGQGGAITTSGTTLRLMNVHFYGNHTSHGGGALLAWGGMTEVTNAAFVGNYSQSSTEISGGGEAVFARGPVVLTNTTFAYNHSGWSNNERHTIRAGPGGQVTVRNSIIWPQSLTVAPLATFNTGAITVSHSVVRGGFEGSEVVDADPAFKRMPRPAPAGTWGNDADDFGDLNLTSSSPARSLGRYDYLPPDYFDLDGNGNIDEPVPVDLAGVTRPVAASVDAGAYRHVPLANTDDGAVPLAFRLEPVAPNPVGTEAQLRFSLPEADAVSLVVYDLMGRAVARPIDAFFPAGEHTATWSTRGVAAGTYVIRLSGGGSHASRRVTVVR